MSDDVGVLVGDDGGRHRQPGAPHRPGASGRPPYRRRRIILALAAAVIVAIVVVGGLVFVNGVRGLLHSAPRDYAGPGTGSVEVQVRPGDSLSAIGQTLVDKGVVASVGAFTDAASANPKSTSIGPGYYRLRSHMSGQAAVTLLLDPSSLVQSRVTIPEGRRMRDILAAIASDTNIPLAELKKAARDPKALGVPSWGQGHPLEGFLYPATYTFAPGTTAAQALRAMVTRFDEEAASLRLVAGAKAVGRSPYEVLTLASIVEREGRVQSDFPKIAEVFYNRLRQGMPLGSDATLFYVLPDSNGPLRQSQLRLNSPYNTRLHPGLPPTPIASPGEAALQAALHPAHGNLLYFVTIDKAGHAAFATNLQDFNRLVARSRANGVQ